MIFSPKYDESMVCLAVRGHLSVVSGQLSVAGLVSLPALLDECSALANRCIFQTRHALSLRAPRHSLLDRHSDLCHLSFDYFPLHYRVNVRTPAEKLFLIKTKS